MTQTETATTDPDAETETEREPTTDDGYEIPDGLHEEPPKEQIRYAMREHDFHRAKEVCEIVDYVQSTCRSHMQEMADDGELEQSRDGRGYYFDFADEDADESEADEADDESDADVEPSGDGFTDQSLADYLDTELESADREEIVEGIEELQARTDEHLETDFGDALDQTNREGMMPVDRAYNWDEYKVDEEELTDYVEVDGEYTTIKTLTDRRKEIGHDAHFTMAGPTGAAKTMAAENLAADLDAPVFTIQCSDGMDMKDVLGGPTLIEDETWWVDGNGTKALLASKPPEQGGYDGPVVLLIDEVNRVSSRIKSAIMALLDSRCEVVLDGRGGEKIKGAPEDLIVVSTMNKGPGYITDQIDNAEYRRLGEEFRIDYLGRADFAAEVELVADQTPASVPLAKLLVETANELRDKADDDSAISFGVTTALLMDWARGAVGREGITDDPVVDASETVLLNKYFNDSDEERTLAEEIIKRNVDECPIGEEEVREYAGDELIADDDDGYLECTSCGWFERVEETEETVRALGMCPACDETVSHVTDA